jgi:hypothetical protein
MVQEDNPVVEDLGNLFGDVASKHGEEFFQKGLSVP